jgi:hypothetical protein
MDWEPEDGLQTPRQVLDAVRKVVAADLARFKDLIEARRDQTGSRRGETLLKTGTG